jgi:predicted metalloprotease with PDZ domain
MGFEAPVLWGDTYWGGALFFLRADVLIRERTKGERSLDDAMLAMHAAGNIRMSMPVVDLLALGDDATGGTELSDLYDELADDEEEFNLSEFFQKLGVSKNEAGIQFDDEAPGAGMRKAMLSPAVEPEATTLIQPND